MAVLPMRRISIYGLKSQRKGVLELLQRRGAVEVIQEPMKEEALSTMDTQAARNQFAATQATAKRALEILDIHCPVKKSPLAMLEGRRPISLEAYNSSLQRVTEIGSTASRIVQLEREREDCKAEILRLQTQLESLTPWLGLDISMRMKGTRSTSVFIGTFPQAYTREQILEALAQKLPEVRGIEVEVLSTLSQQTCVFLVCLSEESAAVETALRSMGFAWPQNPSKKPPSQRAEQLKGWIQEQEKKQDGILQELKTYGDRRDDLCFLYDYYAMRIEKYEVLALLRQSRRTFIITGYLPAQKCSRAGKGTDRNLYCVCGNRRAGGGRGSPRGAGKQRLCRPNGTGAGGLQPSQAGRSGPLHPHGMFLLSIVRHDALRCGLWVE